MSSTQFPDDPIEVTDRIPGEKLRQEITAMLTDPTWESPTRIQITPAVAVQLTRLHSPENVGASIEILVQETAVDVDELISISDLRAKAIEERALEGEDLDDAQREVLANFPTRGIEIPAMAPVCSVIQGILIAIEEDDIWTETAHSDSAPVYFTYAFPVTPEGNVRGSPETSYDQGRENPFEDDALIFVSSLDAKYTAEDMPDELLRKEWSRRQERLGDDVGTSPDSQSTDTSVGDVFYNTKTNEYCWVVAFDSVLGVLLQYEDGTFWDQQLRGDGVPAGPYEDRELPDDYSDPVPKPDEECDMDEHSFQADNPTRARDLDGRGGICEKCGFATTTLMELCGQRPYEHAEFACIGCGTTGSGSELLDRLDEIAVCESCWDDSQTPQENYDRLTATNPSE